MTTRGRASLAMAAPVVRDFCSHGNLWIKNGWKSEFLFASIKEWRNQPVINRAYEKNICRLALITNGNAGYGLARAAPEGMPVYCVVDKRLDIGITNKLRSSGAIIIPYDLSKEMLSSEKLFGIVRKGTGLGPNAKFLDATSGYHYSYSGLIGQIMKAAPETRCIMAPVGSAEVFVGLYAGIRQLPSDKQPLLVGVAPESQNSMADKLNCAFSRYADVLKAIVNNQKNAFLLNLPEKRIIEAFKALGGFGFGKSASVPFGAVQRLAELGVKGEDKVVVIDTGKGIEGRKGWYK